VKKGLVLALALQLAGPAVGLDGALRSSFDLRDPIVQALLPVMARQQEADAAVRSLSSLSPGALPALFHIAESHSLRIAMADGRQLRLDLDPPAWQVVVAAIGRFPGSKQHLETVLAGSPSAAAREVAIRSLQERANGKDLDLLVAFADSGEADLAAYQPILVAFENTLASMLDRDAAAISSLPAVFARAPPRLTFSIARALEQSPEADRLLLLSDLLGVRPQVDGFLLSTMERLAQALPPPAPERARQVVRTVLRSSDAAKIQGALRAAVALEDVDAVPDMILLLQKGLEPVASHALAALRRITREDLGKDASVWDAWFQKERAAWLANAGPLADQLTRGSKEQAASAMHELGHQRLFRHEAAMVLRKGVDRREPALVRLCCQILGRLGSSLGLEALKQAQGHEDPKVREAASQAIRLLSAPLDRAPSPS
jgi:hypothetical protein